MMADTFTALGFLSIWFVTIIGGAFLLAKWIP